MKTNFLSPMKIQGSEIILKSTQPEIPSGDIRPQKLIRWFQRKISRLSRETVTLSGEEPVHHQHNGHPIVSAITHSHPGTTSFLAYCPDIPVFTFFHAGNILTDAHWMNNYFDFTTGAHPSAGWIKTRTSWAFISLSIYGI